MKAIRNFRMAGDFFYCEVTFLPETDDEEFEGVCTVPTFGDGVHLRMSFLLRYPKEVSRSPRTRFSCTAHPNLSPVTVAEETSRFLSIIFKMFEQ